MSFKTSPILNRLKNLKGWKQSSFPIKTSNYSRDITLALKIYLLLKAYLFLNNFKLIMSQLRTYEKSNKILCLKWGPLSHHIESVLKVIFSFEQ